MKLIQFAGFLGSGKTTLILKLGKKLSVERGKKVNIIVNDFGEVDIDGEVIKQYGLDTLEIAGGCVCCTMASSLVKTLDKLKENFDPDFVILEPSGIAYPAQITESLDRSGTPRGLIFVLVDISRFEETIRFKGIILGRRQVKESDIIILNKIDLAESEKVVKQSIDFLKEVNPTAEILTHSDENDATLEPIIDRLILELGEE
jgi:G3E family GTPase